MFVLVCSFRAGVDVRCYIVYYILYIILYIIIYYTLLFFFRSPNLFYSSLPPLLPLSYLPSSSFSFYSPSLPSSFILYVSVLTYTYLYYTLLLFCSILPPPSQYPSSILFSSSLPLFPLLPFPILLLFPIFCSISYFLLSPSSSQSSFLIFILYVSVLT